MPKNRSVYFLIKVPVYDDDRGPGLLDIVKETIESYIGMYRAYKAASRWTRAIIGLLVVSVLVWLGVKSAGGPGWISEAASIAATVLVLVILVRFCFKVVRIGVRGIRNEIKELTR